MRTRERARVSTHLRARRAALRLPARSTTHAHWRAAPRAMYQFQFLFFCFSRFIPAQQSQTGLGNVVVNFF